METQSCHEMDEAELEDLYNWVDEIPFTRQKKNIARDFADGVLVAEIVKHFIPKLVELHNYISYENKNKKKENWHILNRKVFKKLGFELAEDVLNKVINAEQFAIEQVLLLLRRKIDRYIYEQKRHKDQDGKPKKSAPTTTKGEKSGKQINVGYGTGVTKDLGGQVSDRPEADQNMKPVPSDTQKTRLVDSLDLKRQLWPDRYNGEMVPKIAVEEREQEVLAKEETIQILQAKVRRLEHLVHLKDIRIDDLSTMIKEMEDNLRRQKIGKH